MACRFQQLVELMGDGFPGGVVEAIDGNFEEHLGHKSGLNIMMSMKVTVNPSPSSKTAPCAGRSG